MQGPFAGRRDMALYLLVWIILGAALAGFTMVYTQAKGINALLFALPSTLVYAISAGFSSYYLCRANPLGERKLLSIVFGLSVASVLAGFLWTALAEMWNELCLLPGAGWAGVTLSPGLTALLFVFGTLLYGLMAAVNYLAMEFVRARHAERRELESKLLAQEAELRMLRTQIDPHFLFNSLNSISALTSQNPKDARAMTLQLASFFRQSLGMEAHRKVSLREEMALIRHFLSIERVRFGERLVVEEALDKEALDCLVPPMIIQPLVENAVKHGISQLPEGGCITIAAWRDGSRLRITVGNDMDEYQPPGRGKGIGLSNVRQRLAATYQQDARVEWGGRDRHFNVEIIMPMETGGE
ncbi:histidine kinase [Massilia sp. NR 4-1]|nr:histidine kinase [Massilia sp. NR 4-1]